jgi:hypothetical protein
MITVAASVITRPNIRDREIFMITETLRGAPKPGPAVTQRPGELGGRENSEAGRTRKPGELLRVGIDSLTEG